ncbi:MAG: hypothetical protein HYT39_03300 [Candidatus Sungbacteria bacterium]|nr:hypothetical protein [Candidatus Sungbacteria bacterium]
MPTDLSKVSGLAISLDDDLMLKFPHDLMVKSVSERTLDGIRPYLIFKDAEADIPVIYRVWRNLMPMQDEAELSGVGIRYDITIIPPGTFKFRNGQREFFHTAGHYHDTAENALGYPEIYEVLSGRVRSLIQKPLETPDRISETYLIEAGPGEKILIPPGFGHVSINAEDKALVLANVIATNPKYIYGAFEELGGGCYRLLASDDKSMIEIEPNSKYRDIPELKKLTPKKDWFKGYFEPLWNAYINHRDQIAFIIKPESYRKEFFAIGNLYKEIK